MALTREKKEEILKELRENIKEKEAIFFLNFKGVEARGFTDLREKIKENESFLKVAKKTLIRIAFEKEGIDFNPQDLEGEVALVFSQGDPIVSAKALYDFAKEDKNLTILGARLDKSVFTGDKVEELAKLPGKEQLQAQLVSTIAAPLSGFQSVLEGNLKGLLNVLNQKANA